MLVLAGTPIGDPADASPRLARELATADVVAAEDTRRLRRLAAALGVALAGRVVSYYDANEAARTPELVADLRAGRRVLLVTDAGMPSVSDPGYRLVAAAVDAGCAVTAVPGPSAVLTALALSGLPVDRFCFEGFLPRKAGRAGSPARRARRASRGRWCSSRPRTGWRPPWPRWPTAFGADRPAAVCRELTKTYEEVRRGGLAELAAWAADGVRGEVDGRGGRGRAVGTGRAGGPGSRGRAARRQRDPAHGGDRGRGRRPRRQPARAVRRGARRPRQVTRTLPDTAVSAAGHAVSGG